MISVSAEIGNVYWKEKIRKERSKHDSKTKIKLKKTLPEKRVMNQESVNEKEKKE